MAGHWRSKSGWCVGLALVTLALTLNACQGYISDAGGAGADEPRRVCSDGTCAEPATCEVGAIPPTTRVPRLTHEQYANTIRDLLRTAEISEVELTPTVDGLIDDNLARDYRRSAEENASIIAGDSTALSRLVDCDPSEGDACARRFIEEFGLRAYRRPLTADEQARYEALYQRRAELSEDDSFESGIELLVTAILQSPHFLHRVELSEELADADRIIPTDFEMASRLSYLLWNTMPDDELFAAAAAAALHTDDQIDAQVGRMLADDRAKETILRFHERWLGLAGETRAVIDQESGQDVTEPLRASLRAFLSYALFEEDGSLDTLLTSPRIFLDPTLTDLYGMGDGVMGETAPFDMPGERSGILTQPFAVAVNTNPVHRGLFVHRTLLCTSLGTPPPLTADNEAIIEDGMDEPGTTRRQRIEAGFQMEPCHTCHSIINPPGYALEHFDSLGRFRAMDNGVPVDASGEMQIDGRTVSFADANELAGDIADSDALVACYADHWARFVYADSDPDPCLVDPLERALEGGDRPAPAVLRAAALSDVMRYRSTTGWEGP